MHHIAIASLIVSCLAAYTVTTSVHADNSDKGFRFYEHRGTLDDRQRMRTPKLGAAHSISLSSNLGTVISDKQREQIRRLGPWLTDVGLSQNAQSLIRAIQDARVHGLNPENYSLSSIVSKVDLLAHLDKKNTDTSLSSNNTNSGANATLRFQLNELLDTNFIKLAEHLGQGVVNGRELQNRLFRDAPRINGFNLLVSISGAELSVSEVLASISQSHPDYLRLQGVMRDLLTEKASGIARTSVFSDNNAKLITEAADKQLIRERLLETGDLTLDAYMAPNADTELLKSLRTFQSRHGLEQSSFANKATRKALNRSVVDDIEAVALSLERWRWLPRDLGERHIFVNIPDYRVKLKDNGKTALSMPAVVGKFEHQTPSFTRDMSYMEYNPTWTVPKSIANSQLLPKERRKPGYLVSRNFDFLKRVGNRLIQVPANTVTWKDFNSANFPYVLRQRGGAMNALGRMKFMMPNQYAIYLHDTQAKKHFTLNDRAYSHGCIRLGDPDALAQQLMIGDGYTQKDVDRSLRSNATHRIRFRQPIPTHLVYLTTWVDENNNLQVRPDLYRNDNKLLQALRESDTLLANHHDSEGIEVRIKDV